MKSNRFLVDKYVTHLFAVADMLRIGAGLLMKNRMVNSQLFYLCTDFMECPKNLRQIRSLVL